MYTPSRVASMPGKRQAIRWNQSFNNDGSETFPALVSPTLGRLIFGRPFSQIAELVGGWFIKYLATENINVS
jgi:hypothetical protein